MATARCKVSYSDSEGFVHMAYVEAESLYEAVALAVFHFRDEAMASRPAPMTEFTVALDRPAVEHHIRLNQVTKWAEHNHSRRPGGRGQASARACTPGMKKLQSRNSDVVMQRRLSAAELRRDIGSRNLLLAQAVPHESTFGDVASVLYMEVDGVHGNFLPASYRRICACPDWHRRLLKTYTASARVPRPKDRVRRELDCANSSDALLMNIFCYPGITHRRELCSLLGFEPRARPEFGVKPRTPLANGLVDRTEVDMQLGNLFLEAKLTEGDFQRAPAKLVHRYAKLGEVFDVDELPTRRDEYESYQLIRGILAAEDRSKSFVVLLDGRRGDLVEAWFRVVRAVRSSELRTRLAVCTWQELSAVLPRTLQTFMASRFGIKPG